MEIYCFVHKLLVFCDLPVAVTSLDLKIKSVFRFSVFFNLIYKSYIGCVNSNLLVA